MAATKINNKISDSIIKGGKEEIPNFLDAANCFSERMEERKI